DGLWDGRFCACDMTAEQSFCDRTERGMRIRSGRGGGKGMEEGEALSGDCTAMPKTG
ncbi:unnamed protein product, partial [Pleuronectes platessa]